MKSLTVAAVLCMAASSIGAPQQRPRPLFSFKANDNYDSFGLPSTGRHIENVGSQGASWNLNFGKLPFSGKNLMTREQRAQWLPVMEALLKVMETDNPTPGDVNELLVLSRDLQNSIPEGRSKFLGGFGGGFGLNSIEGMGLPESGDVIKMQDGVPHIITQFGVFPLSDTSLMTAEERQQFLPAARTFTSVLKKDTIDPSELNLLLEQSRELTTKLAESNASGNSGSGIFGGFGATSVAGLSGLGLVAGSTAGAGNIGRSASVGGSNVGNKFTDFLLPESGDHIINVPGQGPSFNTKIGKFPIGKNIMSAQERQRFLPVMKALLKVMETNQPAPADVNDLLVKTRNLQKYVPEGSVDFGSFANLEGIESMGIPETGDVIRTIGGQPHIMTTFGAFPLSDVSLMTDEERQQFLPATRSFIKVLEKDNLDAAEMNTLLAQSRELTNLIPGNLLTQFSGGLNGLAGFGK